MKKVRKGQVIQVLWKDAMHIEPGAWCSKSSVLKRNSKCTTIGRVVAVERNHIIIAHTFDNSNSNITGVFAIPRPMIKKIKRLK